jgi:hypothetical protein
MFDSSALAAFYMGAAEEWKRLEASLSGPPSHGAFVRHVRRSPMLDPRAEEMRLKFGAATFGVSELSARLRHVAPSCLGACPECLELDRFGRVRYLDRNFLTRFLSVSKGAAKS